MPYRVTVVLNYKDPSGAPDLLFFHLTVDCVPRVGERIIFESMAVGDLFIEVTAVSQRFYVRAAPLIEIDAREVTGEFLSRKWVTGVLERHEQAELARGEYHTDRFT